jgi:2-oxoglutarate ferredoxin oxidoreductase subunit delta
MQATPVPTPPASPRRRAPLDLQQVARREGQVFVIVDRCKGCSFCVDFCPLSVLELAPDFNAKGYHPPRVRPSEAHRCVACGFCTLVCPEYAIFSMPVASSQEARG